MYEGIFKKFDQLKKRLEDKITSLEMLYLGRGVGNIFTVRGHDGKITVNTLATFDSLEHLHNILTVFLESGYYQIILHELDEQLERQERQ